MSKLVFVNYRISEAEERESRRKVELIRSMLERCARMRSQLAKLEPVAGEDWTKTLDRYQKYLDTQKWSEFVDDYNRLYDELPGIEQKLERELAVAKGKRLRLELTAATLLASTTNPAARNELEVIARGAGNLFADNFLDAQVKIEKLVRDRLATPLHFSKQEMSEDQLALARDLLAGSPKQAPGGLSGSVQTVSTENVTSSPRVIQLLEKLSRLQSASIDIDDLIADLKRISALSAVERSLKIDSIELEAQDRIKVLKQKREIERMVDDGLAWLSSFSAATAEAMRKELTAAGAAGDVVMTRIAAEKARAWAESEWGLQDGERIRSLLVNELQELGYEVNLQGAGWNEGSRITIVKPSEPNYDVQLSAAPGGGIQSKVRAYSHAGRSDGVNRRDVEIEQSWCDDLARLNKKLAERGIASVISHEEAPGSSVQLPLPARNDRSHSRGAAEIKSRKL